MASLTKKSWKIQEFAAHSANVTCLALGHKSGRVLVTGGDDRKVNLWAVGKPTCIMSLSGHSTPVTSVKFNHTEELVVAGAQAGALKVWDLEAARLVRTLTGHRSSIRCSDFHPYGDFLTSGSQDTSIKLWDTRRKGCIFTYKGHQMAVNSLNFSPDGQWIASGGDDGFVKVWDLRMGRVLKEFSDHTSPVTSVEFHPHEFLLASGSLDRTVNFWDLESFQLVSTEKEAGAVRCLAFNPGGECLYAGSTDTLRVLAWEPSRILDVLAVGWSRVNDIAIAQNQLIGASFHMANIMLYVVEIKKMQPFDVSRAVEPFARSSVRRSFLREGSVELSPKTAPQVKTIEESTSGTDQDEDASADIPNINDYREVFKPNRSLVRTPPPTPFLEPAEDEIIDPTQPQIITSQSDSEYLSLNSLEIQGSSLPHQTHSLELETKSESRTSPHLAAAFHTNRSVSNLENVFNTRSKKTEPVSIRHHRQQISECIDNSPESEPVRPPSQRAKSPASAANSPPQRYIRRQVSCKEDETFQVVSSGLKHSVSEVNVNRPVRSNSFNRNTRPKDLPVKLNSNRASINPPRVPSSGRPLDKPIAVRPTSVSISDNTPRNVSSRTIDNAVKNLKNSISSLSEPVDFIPMSVDKPVGLDLDDFLPKSHRLIQNNRSTMTQISEEEALESLTKGHAPMMTVLESRVRSLNLVYSVWHNKGVKSALEGALAMNDLAILVDILSVMVLKTSLWNLGICVIMLPKVQELLQSKYETYVQTGCNALQLILQSFGPVISNTVRAGAGSALGVDITREERHSKCTKCHSSLVNIRAVLLKRQTVQGPLGSALRDLHTRVTQTLESST